MSRPSSKLNAANTFYNLCAQYVVNLYWEQSFKESPGKTEGTVSRGLRSEQNGGITPLVPVWGSFLPDVHGVDADGGDVSETFSVRRLCGNVSFLRQIFSLCTS